MFNKGKLSIILSYIVLLQPTSHVKISYDVVYVMFLLAWQPQRRSIVYELRLSQS